MCSSCTTELKCTELPNYTELVLRASLDIALMVVTLALRQRSIQKCVCWFEGRWSVSLGRTTDVRGYRSNIRPKLIFLSFCFFFQCVRYPHNTTTEEAHRCSCCVTEYSSCVRKIKHTQVTIARFHHNDDDDAAVDAWFIIVVGFNVCACIFNNNWKCSRATWVRKDRLKRVI